MHSLVACTSQAHSSSAQQQWPQKQNLPMPGQASSALPTHLIAASAWPDRESEPEPGHEGMTEPGVHVRSRPPPLLSSIPEPYCNPYLDNLPCSPLQRSATLPICAMDVLLKRACSGCIYIFLPSRCNVQAAATFI